MSLLSYLLLRAFPTRVVGPESSLSPTWTDVFNLTEGFIGEPAVVCLLHVWALGLALSAVHRHHDVVQIQIVCKLFTSRFFGFITSSWLVSLNHLSGNEE